MEKTDTKSMQRVTTPEFRVSFPHVFKPSAAGPKAEPKYSITMLFKKSQDLSALKLAIKHAKIEKYGPDKSNWPDDLESPVSDGNDQQDKEGYEDCWVIKASTSQDYKPTVVDENVEPIMDQSTFYPGCYARAQVYARVWEFGNKQGVHFILDMVQKTKDGKPFSNKKSAKEVFAPIDRRGQASSDEEGDESNASW